MRARSQPHTSARTAARTPRARRAGFTLIEVMLVVIILGAFYALAAGSFRSSGSSLNQTTAAATVRGAMADARALGIRYAGSDAVVEVRFAASRIAVTRDGVEVPQYTRVLPASNTLAASPATVAVASDGMLATGGTVTLTPVGGGAVQTLTFDRAGIVR